jgi:hypothetical protein
MIMPLDELIQRLVNVSPEPKYFLSLYLDLRPDHTGKKMYPVFLKNRLPELLDVLPAHSAVHSFLEKDLKTIHKYLEENLNPAWKGIALFVSSYENLLICIPMFVPPENKVDLASTPYLFSLIQHAELYQNYAIMVADPRQARLFLVALGYPEKQTTLSWKDERTARSERMGWSLPRFRRHQAEHMKQRTKEISENLEKLTNAAKTDYLFAVAEEEVLSELKKHLSPSFRNKLFPLPSVKSHDPDHKIFTAAFDAVQSIAKERAETLAKRILEEAEPVGQATVGPEPTLSALQSHQIEQLVMDAKFAAEGWACQGCLRLGIGGLPSNCPICGKEIRPANLREEIIFKAKRQGLELSFTKNFSPLIRAGGIAARLKYKTLKKTSS